MRQQCSVTSSLAFAALICMWQLGPWPSEAGPRDALVPVLSRTALSSSGAPHEVPASPLPPWGAPQSLLLSSRPPAPPCQPFGLRTLSPAGGTHRAGTVSQAWETCEGLRTACLAAPDSTAWGSRVRRVILALSGSPLLSEFSFSVSADPEPSYAYDTAV